MAEEKQLQEQVKEKIETPTSSEEQVIANVQKNTPKILGAIGLAILAAVLFVMNGGDGVSDPKNIEANNDAYKAIALFEKDSLDAALNGKDGAAGLLQIAQNNSGTKMGNLANFYVGNILLQKGDYDQALTYLQKYQKSNILIDAMAECNIGDCYMEKGDYTQALANYKKAMATNNGSSSMPWFLKKAAVAAINLGNYAEAQGFYEEIKAKHSKAPEAQDVDKQINRMKALAGK